MLTPSKSTEQTSKAKQVKYSTINKVKMSAIRKYNIDKKSLNKTFNKCKRITKIYYNNAINADSRRAESGV